MFYDPVKMENRKPSKKSRRISHYKKIQKYFPEFLTTFRLPKHFYAKFAVLGVKTTFFLIFLYNPFTFSGPTKPKVLQIFGQKTCFLHSDRVKRNTEIT